MKDNSMINKMPGFEPVSVSDVRSYVQRIAKGKESCFRINDVNVDEFPAYIAFAKNAEDFADEISAKIDYILKWYVVNKEVEEGMLAMKSSAYNHAFASRNLCELMSRGNNYDSCTAIELSSVLKKYVKYIKEFTSAGASGNVSLRCNVRKGAYVHTHAAKFTVILMNLIINAFKHAHSVSNKVDIVLSRVVKDKIAVTVLDYGIGVDVNKLNTFMHNRLLRMERGSDFEKPYSGIGLLVCAKLANMMNADIYASNYDGAGAAFTILFDAAYEAADAKNILRDADADNEYGGEDRKLIYMAMKQCAEYINK